MPALNCMCLYSCIRVNPLQEQQHCRHHRVCSSSVPSPHRPPPHLLLLLLLPVSLGMSISKYRTKALPVRAYRTEIAMCVFVGGWTVGWWTVWPHLEPAVRKQEVCWSAFLPHLCCVICQRWSSLLTLNDPLLQVCFKLVCVGNPDGVFSILIPPSGPASSPAPHSIYVAPHPHSIRIGCPALRPCAEEALARSSMGAALAGTPSTPSAVDLLPPPPPHCPSETGAPPSAADGRRN